MSLAISLILVVFFLAMNAFFVIAEFSLVRVRKSQLELGVEQGQPGADKALDVAENINAYLSACQLGITLASLALGWLGEPAFADLIEPICRLFNMPDAAVSVISVAVGYFLLTTLHVVVGELIPKSFAIFDTEGWAVKTAGVLRAFYKITYPIMVLFNGITNWVVRLSGHDPANEHEVYTGEEIMLLIDESTESGLIEPAQNEYVDNIFDLGEKDAAAIMTPRTDMICIDLNDSLEENVRVIKEYKFTRYPVCRGTKDRIIGFLHVKDLYGLSNVKSTADLPIRNIPAVPEGIPIAKLLQTLQSEHTEIAVVIDEHGGTAGIVTMSDIMEQIVGRTDDEYQHGESEDAVKLEDGSLLIDGLMPIDDLVEVIGFEPEEAAECDTAGGLLMSLFDRIPAEGDTTSIERTTVHGSTKATFTVVDMDNHRIDKIRMVLETTVIEDEDEDEKDKEKDKSKDKDKDAEKDAEKGADKGAAADEDKSAAEEGEKSKIEEKLKSKSRSKDKSKSKGKEEA